MIPAFSKIAVLGLLSSGLLFIACAEKGEVTAAVTLPEAPDAAIQTVVREFAQGNGGILWQALPASYRSDVNALVQLAGRKFDAELYDQSCALIGRIGEVVDKQQAFILNSTLAQRSDAEKSQFQQALPALVGLLETLTTSDLASSAGLLAFDGQQFCNSTVSQIVTYANELAQRSDGAVGLSDYVNLVVSVVEAGEVEATLQLALPGRAGDDMRFTKVEGRWLPAELAADWSTEIGGAQAKLEAISVEALAASKPQVLGVLTMLDGVLTQIEAAETQAQFDQALQGAMMPLMGLLMMGQGMGGSMASPVVPPMPPSNLPAVK